MKIDILELYNALYYILCTEKEHGKTVKNLSDWNLSSEYRKKLLEIFKIDSKLHLNYLFSETLTDPSEHRLSKKLGVREKDIPQTTEFIFPTNSNAMTHALNLLSILGKKKLCILTPGYFSVPICAEKFGLQWERVQINHEKGRWWIPVEEILEKGFDSVFVTSPIYSAGVYFDQQMKSQISSLINANLFVVFDECQCLSGSELVRDFSIKENTAYIYSPHKAIAVNGLKFSALLCHKKYFEQLDYWFDIFTGSLGQSTVQAFDHFLSDNYEQCLEVFYEMTDANKKIVQAVLADFPFAWTESNTKGYYITVFVDKKISDEDEYNELFTKMCENLGYVAYPNILNGYSDDFFSFRINLTLDPFTIKEGLTKILEFLATEE